MLSSVHSGLWRKDRLAGYYYQDYDTLTGKPKSKEPVR